MLSYQNINAKTIDHWNKDGWEWGTPISHETFINAKNGTWDVVLTPTKPVPHDWFGDLSGKKVLGLASGGGQQMPIFAALVAEREGYEIHIVRADMTKPFPFPDESFDLIFHPVSNCYIEEVESVWRECARVLRPGGRLLAGLDNGINYVFDESETKMCFSLPFNPLQNPDQMQFSVEKNEGIQFSHTIEEQIGGQLRAGFILKDIFGDTNGVGLLHEHNVPTFWASLAIKP